jgi:hypothetical protein
LGRVVLMAKPLPQEYAPSNPPTKFEGWHRWIVEELHRIARRFNSNPGLFIVRTEDQPVNISPVPTALRLGVGGIPEVDYPGGDFDELTGIWTCPLDGVYMLTAAVEIAPFGTGNKAYQADIVLFKNAVEVARSIDSAVDDVPLSVNMKSPAIVLGGDELYLDLVTVHAQFTGVSTYDFSWSMLRAGSAI